MKPSRRTRQLSFWLASVGASVMLAAASAMVVLADASANPCLVDGQPVSEEFALASPDQCDPGTGPNADGGSTEPDPGTGGGDEGTDPTGGGTDPGTGGGDEGTDPGDGTDPGGDGTDPSGGDGGEGTDPTTDDGTDPGDGTDPTTDDGTDPEGDTPGTDPGDSTQPDDDAGTKPRKAKRRHVLHVSRPVAVRHIRHSRIPFRDARTFREHYTPTGRIPELPDLSQESVDMLAAAADAAGTDVALLAAVAWLDSRWGNPVAGGFIGGDLSTADWAAYGSDGDGDGSVDHASDADRAATVAKMLATIAAEKGEGAALKAYFDGHMKEVRRARFLADFFDAIGEDGLAKGLDDPDVRDGLATAALNDDRITIYPGGRSDIEAGLIDPRVLVTLRFLANRFDTVTVSSLVTGHGVFTSSGNVSLHSYGQAVDIAVLDGQNIYGHQRGPRNVTVRALKDVLRLPKSMQPFELISLWELGGPSFALSDHDDHIHIGWKTEQDPASGVGSE